MRIQTERLLFRPYDDGDLQFLFSLLSDSKTVRFIGNGRTRDRKGARKFLERIYRTYEMGSDMELRVLIRKDDNIPIGHAGLVPQTVDGMEEIEIGYWVARDYWGQGYATEAAAAVRDHGIHQLRKQRPIALIQKGNTASQRVAKKIGMNLEKDVVRSGRDVLVYAISGK